MVQLLQDLYFVLQGLRVLHHLLGNELDHSVGVGRLFQSRLVDHAIGSSPKDLTKPQTTLGLNS
jgi:hypothetical protein